MRLGCYFWSLAALSGLTSSNLAAADTADNAPQKDVPPYYAMAISSDELAALKESVIADFAAATEKYHQNMTVAQDLINSSAIIGQAAAKRLIIIDNLIHYIGEELKGNTVDNVFKAKKAVRELRQFNAYLESAATLYRADQALKTFRISVKDFGATGDGVTDDGPAIRKAIAHAATLGGKTTVFLPRGNYLIAAAEPDWDYRKNPVLDRTCDIKRQLPLDRAHIALINRENLIIEGEPGTELYFGSYGQNGFSVFGCRNVTLRNLSLGYRQTPPFSQGTIIAVDSATKSCVFQPDAGFPSPEDPRFDKSRLFGFTRTADGTDFVRSNASCSTYHFSRIENLGDNRFRFFLNAGYRNLCELAAGQKFTFFGRSNYPYVVRTRFSAFCTLDRLTVRDAANAIFSSSNNLSLHVADCMIKPQPGHLGITPADGLFSGDNLIAPYLSGTTFSHIGDDGFNIFAHSRFIQRLEGRDIEIEASTIVFTPGDLVQLLSPVTGQVIAENIVEKAEHITVDGKRKIRITLEKEFPVPVVVGNTKYSMLANISGEKKELEQIPHILLNADREGIGAVAVGNTFMNCSNNAIRVRAPNVLVENNTITNQQRCAVIGEAAYTWNEIPGPHNLIIRDNRINGATHGVHVFLNNLKGTRLAVQAFGAISVVNNTIENCHVPIAIANAEYVTVENNKIDGIDGTNPPITVKASGAVVKNNTIGTRKLKPICR